MSSATAAQSLPCIPILEQTPIIIEKILTQATEDHLAWKPSQERWSIGEVLAHLADVELVFRGRAEKMAQTTEPAFEDYDQNAAYAAGKYSGGNPRERLKAFCHERDRTLSLLRYLPASAAARAARHSELGRFTLDHLLNGWAYHDLGHIRQIAEIYRSRALYPRMGPFQREYNPKP